MKNLRLLLLNISLILTIFCSSAENKSSDNGFEVSVSFGVFHSDNNYTLFDHTTYHDRYNGLILAPRISYRFNQKWSVGLLYKYQQVLPQSYIMDYGVFGQYTIVGSTTEGFRFFTDFQAAYSRMSYDYVGGSIPKLNNVEVGFTPGLAYHIPGSPVNLLLRYLFVGLNTNKAEHVRKWAGGCLGGCLGGGDWVLDAGLHRLQIGASITF